MLHFHKEGFFVFICHTSVLHLAMALHRGPGSNKVQREFNNTCTPGGCRATQQLNTDTNGFTFTHTDGQEATKIDKNKGCRHRKKTPLLFEWARQYVWAVSAMLSTTYIKWLRHVQELSLPSALLLSFYLKLTHRNVLQFTLSANNSIRGEGTMARLLPRRKCTHADRRVEVDSHCSDGI